MAIESVPLLRRLIRATSLVWIVVLSMCGVAGAQVTSGSVVPFFHSTNTTNDTAWGQVTQIAVAHNGSVLFIDYQNGALYQLSPGSTTPTTVSAAGDVLGAWNNTSIALDNYDNLYISARYNSPNLYFVPYNASTGTWSLTGSSILPAASASNNYATALGNGTYGLAFDDSNNLYFSTVGSPEIVKLPLDKNGNALASETVLVSGLQSIADALAVDHAGNVYFVENVYTNQTSTQANGLWEIPVGVSGIVGNGNGSAEASGKITRFDPAAAGYGFMGITVDVSGDLFLTSSVSDYANGSFNGVLEIPNTGTPTAPVFDTNYDSTNKVWENAIFIAPTGAMGGVAVDPRGFLWVPAYSSSGWTPNGSNALPGSQAALKWMPGATSIQAYTTTTGGVSSTTNYATIFYNFSKATTPASVLLSQAGSAFALTSNNPLAATGSTTTPCAGAATYNALTYCANYAMLTPSYPGSASANLALLDSSNNALSGSGVFINGIGQGAGAAFVTNGAELTSVGSMTTPGQIAADGQGNVYVLDTGAAKIVKYTHDTIASGGTALTIAALKAPTGIAVDPVGNLYIADSGKIYRIVSLNGALQTGSIATIQTGLSASSAITLAADGFGNVYAADPVGMQVVRVYSTYLEFANTATGVKTFGSGFSAPSEITVDANGDVLVVDGVNLYEITPSGSQSVVTKSLGTSVTGVATDASGSIYIAQSGGVIRIPLESGGLNMNDVKTLASDLTTTPSGLAIDGMGNIYVTYGSTATATLAQVGISGLINYGQIPPNVSNDAEAQVFNIGNQALTFSATPDVISGVNAAAFVVGTPGDTPACDLTGATSLATGSFCYYDVTATPTATGTQSAAVAIGSNALNTSSLILNLAADSENDTRPATTTAVTYSPASGIAYPGAVTITVTVTGTGTPVGEVTLSVSNHGSETVSLNSSGAASFKFSGLAGGTYKVKATYLGNGTTPTGFAVSYVNSSFTVAPAVSTVTLPAPATYLLYGGTNKLTANVASTAGTPSGYVIFKKVTSAGESLADASQPQSALDGNGNATFNTSNLAVGTFTIKAEYQGSVNFAAASSSTVTFQMVPPSILIATTTPSVSTSAGTTVAVPVTLTSIVGYDSSKDGLQMECVTATLPSYSECTFNVPQPTVIAGSPAKLNVSLSTNVPVNVAANRHSGAPLWSLASLLGLGMMGVAAGRKRLHKTLMRSLGLALLALSALTGFTACTNNGYTHTPVSPVVSTPSGTYAISVITIDATTGVQVSLPFTVSVTVQ